MDDVLIEEIAKAILTEARAAAVESASKAASAALKRPLAEAMARLGDYGDRLDALTLKLDASSQERVRVEAIAARRAADEAGAALLAMEDRLKAGEAALEARMEAAAGEIDKAAAKLEEVIAGEIHKRLGAQQVDSEADLQALRAALTEHLRGETSIMRARVDGARGQVSKAVAKADAAVDRVDAALASIEQMVIERVDKALARDLPKEAGLSPAWRGPYDPETRYAPGDLTISEGSTWIACSGCRGQRPAVASGNPWEMFAARGAAG